jgi:hypothetical protein
MRSDRLKQVMQQIDANFDERTAGFNRFSKFVVEAGQKGVLLVNKLDNGQYEVAPVAGGAPVAAPPRDESAREEGGRRGRSRRGRGRGGDRDRPADRERTADSGRDEGRRPPAREARPDGALTLARAFQLLTQALGELRAPVGHEALRLRMAALHGRQDQLLDAARFPRLLRQANDAEVADVRKVSEDEYEISPHRTSGPMPVQPAAPVAASAPPISAEPAPAEEEAIEAAAGRENGQRFGVRFRRGSRAPVRAGEIPLIGVVEVDIPTTIAEPVGAEPAAAEEPAPAAKPARPRRAPRKRATATVASAEPAEGGEGAEATPRPKRARSRTRKKAAE